jgi:hypothetical protein
MSAQSPNWLEIITASSTAAAAIAAAISARTSLKSTKAAQDAVSEARLSKRKELEPKIVLEKTFFSLRFIFPHRSAPDGQPAYMARVSESDEHLALPSFRLDNFGQTPALDVSLEWTLDVQNNFVLPEAVKPLGLSISPHSQVGAGFGPRNLLTFAGKQGGSSVPLYVKWTTSIPNSSPGQPREINFPREILHAVFTKSLEHGSGYSPIELVARIRYRSSIAGQDETQFRWELVPFWHYEVNPLRCYSHFRELPMYPDASGSPVA